MICDDNGYKRYAQHANYLFTSFFLANLHDEVFSVCRDTIAHFVIFLLLFSWVKKDNNNKNTFNSQFGRIDCDMNTNSVDSVDIC